jgi:hypothetical protein
MKEFEFAEMIIKMPVENQNEFFEALKGELSEEDWNTIVKFISLFSMFKSPAKYEAMKKAVGDTLSEEIFGHTVEQKDTHDYAANPVYMTSIL